MISKLNVGILGATEVAKRVIINPSKLMDTFFVYGVASKDFDRAKKFSADFGIPNIYKTYDELILDSNIDIVYIPLATCLHSEWIINCLKKGKNVLVEKPLCLNSLEANNIKKTLEQSKGSLFEGCMVQHHPWTLAVLDLIKRKEFGKLLSIETEFAYPFPDYYINSYINKGGGVFIHDAVYWLQFVQKCIGLNPNNINAYSKFDGPGGIELSLDARMDYSNGLFSTFSCSWKKPFKAKHSLKFENAEVIIPNFLKPSFGISKFKIEIKDLKSNSEFIEFIPQDYYVNQLNYIYNSIINKENSRGLFELSVERIVIMEKLYKKAKENASI